MLFHHKLRSSSSPSPLFCCFHNNRALITAAYHETASSDCDDSSHPCKVRAAALELPLPEIWYKCHNLIAWIGRCRWRSGHAVAAAVASSEFGYDPMSYALNFEDDRKLGVGQGVPSKELLSKAATVSESVVADELVACN